MSFQASLSGIPLQSAHADGGVLRYRVAGRNGRVTHVLLHGIGSASASWVLQLQAAQGDDRVQLLAWDAPGYGASSALPAESPRATDYAARLWTWLDAVGATEPVLLVGHSLGALMATRAAAERPDRVGRLLLLAPARGYGSAPAAERERRLNERLATLQSLGPAGMADRRAAAMLSPNASAEQVAFVHDTMAQVVPAGYVQAARLLAGGDLIGDLLRVRCPIAVACGAADTITPPEACAAVAQAAGVALQDLGPVGHACPLEAAAAVNQLLGLDPSPRLAP